MPSPVLVVESDRAARAELIALLERAGYDAIGVDTVPAGLRVLRDGTASLLISALRVEGYNGLQLLAMSPRSIPAIILASAPDPVLELETRQMGGEFLVKPLREGALAALVEQKLTGRGGATPLRELRRWARKRAIGPLAARIDAAPARIVDVSYGGLRFELDAALGRPVPRSFRMTLPSFDVDVDVDVVWESTSTSRTMIGATVGRADRPVWRQFVDTMA